MVSVVLSRISKKFGSAVAVDQAGLTVVALGRAMTTSPRVLLIDEPLSDIDPPNRLKMRGKIFKFHRECRLTTTDVTHNLADAMALADRIAVMRAGRFEQADTAENLVRQPASSYVADFFKASELRQKSIFVHKNP